MEFPHCGLYFTSEHIQQARQARDREPFKGAWALLESDPPHASFALQWDGLRYRFGDDQSAGETAARTLLALGAGAQDASYIEQVESLLALVQVFEMIRDHAAFAAGEQAQWLDHFGERVIDLNRAGDVLHPVETLWLGTLNLAAGVVLEREDWVEAGINVYQRTVRDEIRPEGYLPKAVSGQDGGSLYRDLIAVEALVLSAEIASHLGIDLWNFASRGVSVMTACAYLFFYYYYPGKWRWDNLSESESPQAFREHGSFLEMVYRRARPADVKLILEDLRPLYDVAGGLTTLTHGTAASRRLFG